MPGMPDPVETSAGRGGSALFFRLLEYWLNGANRQANRAAALNAVAGNLAGVPTVSVLNGPPAPTLAGNPGINHFNAHWRGGPSGWWPNITPDRVSS